MKKLLQKRTRLEPGPVLFDIFRTARKVTTYVLRDEDGSIEERSSPGALAYFLQVPAFEAFLAAYRHANQIAGEIQYSRHMGKSEVSVSKADDLVNFNRKYGLLVDTLIHPAELPNGRRVPFINPFYFPRSAKDMKFFWKFVDAAGEAYGFQRGEVAGRPPGKSKYSVDQLERYERLRRKKKSSSRAIEMTFPAEFKDDRADPFKRLKPALSRLRKKKR